MNGFLALAAMTLSTALAASPGDLPAELPPAEEAAALRAASGTGMRIFEHDRAAAAATDALGRERAFRRDRGGRGWITEAQDDGILVTFLGAGAEGEPVARFRVRVDREGRVVGRPSVLETPQPLNDFEAAAARARALAVETGFAPCTERYNAVVLPAGEGLDAWVAYLLPGTTRRNVVPVGGTYRVDIGLAAGAVALRPYTRTCIQLENEPRAVGLMITHLLDAVPTEVHVFWSLWAGKPIYVATPPNGAVWAVEGASVRNVSRGQGR